MTIGMSQSMRMPSRSSLLGDSMPVSPQARDLNLRGDGCQPGAQGVLLLDDPDRDVAEVDELALHRSRRIGLGDQPPARVPVKDDRAETAAVPTPLTEAEDNPHT